MNYKQLCAIITDILPKQKEISSESRLSSDLGLCSFDMMLLIFRVEEASGIQIDASSLKKDITVEELLNIVGV